jgi:capsular polysaccharide biosynthesis protein
MAPAGNDRAGIGGGIGSALGQLGGLASLAGISVGGTGTDTDEALAVLKSREFTESFISDHNLLPTLFPAKWNSTSGQWNVPPDERPTLGKAYKLFDKKIRSIIQDKKTGLVTLQIDWKDRQKAADWANELVQRLNAEMRARAIKRSEGSVEYLERELMNTPTVATREAINRLIETQVKQRMFANVSQEYVFRVVDRALPADLDDPESPKKLYLLIEGLLLGLAIGVVGALLLSDRTKY